MEGKELGKEWWERRGMNGRSERKEIRGKEGGEQLKKGYEENKERERRRDRKEKRGMMGRIDRNE